MLGHKLVQVLSKDFDVWTSIRRSYASVDSFRIFDREKTIDDIDVEDFANLNSVLEKLNPDVVINAVGIIKQLPEASDSARLNRINTELPHELEKMSQAFDYRLICIGTDCVFSGSKGNYSEVDIPDATDIYGRSKLLGEVTNGNCLTIRTSIIGRELATSHSLVEWFLQHRGKSVNGYTNAIYSGFPTIVLANIIARLISDYPSLNGLYHISSDPISKFSLLDLINDVYKTDIEILPVNDVVINRSLDCSRFKSHTGFEPATWKAMIEQMVDDYTPYDNLLGRING